MTLRGSYSVPPIGGGQAAGVPLIISSTPTTGQTVNFANSPVDQTIYATPAGTLASLTLTLPSDATSQPGQICRFFTSQALTVLTVNGAVTIRNAPVSSVINDCCTFQKVAANTWIRLL